MKTKKVILLILDGWGYGKKDASDAINQANTPVFDNLIKQYPNATLRTDGELVGLPDGQMGNSEVGHLNIGAGRVIYQELVKINKAIEEKSIDENPNLIKAFNYAKKENKKIHFLGLVSNGGIHSHTDHLVALCKIAAKHGVKESFIHAFTDGRDSNPKTGKAHIERLQKQIASTPTKIASLIGRYYAMDRDLRWERIQKAYNLLLKGEGKESSDLIEAIEASYQNNITDEFIEPIVAIDENNKPLANIEADDVVIFFNFRTDRCRQLVRALSQENFDDFGMKRLPLHLLTMTNYDETYKNVNVIFEKDNLKNTLGEVISDNNLKQIRIAETEKYPHVTFFFSGGRETVFNGEKRIMVPSPKVATYDLQPEMSAEEVTRKILQEIENVSADFICLNFANPDMVGHTGVKEAIIKAVEKVDQSLGEILELGKEKGYSFVIIADHGNAEFIVNEDGSPNTAHTTNPVPVILIDEEFKSIHSGKLADIAPSILTLMHLKIPKEMTGNVLVN
tara:strand:+ start:49763 stop:51286 length:1524 start_codon:yes stop_codon:yes gene_type:complete